jgi:hypothetical protein
VHKTKFVKLHKNLHKVHFSVYSQEHVAELCRKMMGKKYFKFEFFFLLLFKKVVFFGEPFPTEGNHNY